MTRQLYQGDTSVMLRVMLRDAANAGKTGIVFNGGIVVTLTTEHEQPSNLSPQAISVIGTYEAPSGATSVRFGEVDATRTPGLYELHFHDTAMSTGLHILNNERFYDLFIKSNSAAFVEYWEPIQILPLIDGKTPQQALQIIAAGVLGKVSGAGTATEVFKGLDGSTTRATVTADASGNRTAVAYG